MRKLIHIYIYNYSSVKRRLLWSTSGHDDVLELLVDVVSMEMEEEEEEKDEDGKLRRENCKEAFSQAVRVEAACAIACLSLWNKNVTLCSK